MSPKPMPSREEYDLLIVGGGINGCGIARDAAGRGLSVLLVEQFDLAGATSSASSKLIHGGLRYLEQCAFRLVRESLRERQILLSLAPHLITPLRLVLPHVRQMRPAWLIRCGLLLYDWLAGGDNPLPRSKKITLKDSWQGAPLQGLQRLQSLPRKNSRTASSSASVGFEYYDCWADDARLTVLNAQDAKQRGAEVLTRTRCQTAQAEKRGWTVQLKSTAAGAGDAATADDSAETRAVRAKCLINATGPWAARFLQQALLTPPPPLPLRLVQGSHIVVPALYTGAHGYLLQNDDGRVIFVLPYEKKFSLVGTTDRDFTGNPQDAAVSAAEVDYLLAAVRKYFGAAPAAAQVVRRFCGVRPLADGGGGAAQNASRDYALQLQQINGAPLLTICGGKLTTYRRLAEEAMQRLAAVVFPALPPPWSNTAPLPGGNLPPDGVAGIAASLRRAHRRITAANATRLAAAYGALAAQLPPPPAANNETNSEKWHCFGEGLFAWEVDYLMENEWAQEAEDILWRRGALGMHFSPQQTGALASYMRARASASTQTSAQHSSGHA